MSEKWLKAEIIAKKILIFSVLAGAGIIGFILIPNIISFLLPFVIAYIISLIASPLTALFRKLRLPSTLSAIISILFVAAALFGVSAALINKIVSELYDFSSSMPELYQSVLDTFDELRLFASHIFGKIPEGISVHITDAVENLGSTLTALSGTIVEFISTKAFGFLKNVPLVLITIIFSVLASYFLIRDKNLIKASLSHVLGPEISEKLNEIRVDMFGALFAYLRAQGILMSITFVEVFLALSILRIKYSFLFAIVIAFVDAIPVFGTGTILLPWALFSLITGKYPLTIGLCILYAVCLIVRQLLEPKILSSQIGMHPLLTILSMYVGFRSIGILGMILGPVIVLIAKNFTQRYFEKHHIIKEETDCV